MIRMAAWVGEAEGTIGFEGCKMKMKGSFGQTLAHGPLKWFLKQC